MKLFKWKKWSLRTETQDFFSDFFLIFICAMFLNEAVRNALKEMTFQRHFLQGKYSDGQTHIFVSI